MFKMTRSTENLADLKVGAFLRKITAVDYGTFGTMPQSEDSRAISLFGSYIGTEVEKGYRDWKLFQRACIEEGAQDFGQWVCEVVTWFSHIGNVSSNTRRDCCTVSSFETMQYGWHRAILFSHTFPAPPPNFCLQPALFRWQYLAL